MRWSTRLAAEAGHRTRRSAVRSLVAESEPFERSPTAALLYYTIQQHPSLRQGCLMGLHGSARWRRMAKHQLRVSPLCEMCLREGRGPVPARVADHITPHHNDPNKFWLGKLQSLCTHCHEGRKKFRELYGYDKA